MKVSKVREVAAIMTGVLILGGVLVAEAVEPPPVIWSVTFHGVSDDWATGVAVGPDGHPVVTGISATDSVAGDDIRTIKYNKATGAIIWSTPFNGGDDVDDFATGVAIGADGHPVIVGDVIGAPFLTYDIRIIKYDGTTGAVLWTATLDSGGQDFGRAVAVGPDGHPIVMGESAGALRVVKYDGMTGMVLWDVVREGTSGWGGIAAGPDGHVVVSALSGSISDLRVIKYNGATGAVLWSVTLPDGQIFNGVAVGPDNHPVVTGDHGFSGNIRTVKFDGGTGAVLWTAIFDSGASDSARSVAVGPDGHPIVAGSLCCFFDTNLQANLSSYQVIKLDGGSGSERWRFQFNRFERTNIGAGVAVAPDGNAVVTGTEGNPADYSNNMRTLQFLEFVPAVPSLWNITFDRGVGDEAFSVVVGPDSHPVVTGSSCEPGCASTDLQTIKLDSTTGTVLWSVVFDNAGSEQGRAIGVGPDGHLVVTGASCAPDFSLCDARTIKYDGGSGAIIWNVTFDTGGEDRGDGVSIGPDGHPVVTVFSCTASSCGSRVIKYNGTTGSILWNVSFGVEENSAGGVAVGPDGHPVVTGTVLSIIRTIKFDGATGAELWNVTFDSGRGEYSDGVAVGPDGHPVVVGSSAGGGFRTIKYNGASGAIIWTATFGSVQLDDEGMAVAVGADGHPVVTGISTTEGSQNFRTIKYDKATGAVLWSVVFDSGGFDEALGVSVGPDGNPVVAGTSCGAGLCRVRTIKYILPYETAPGSNIGVTLNGGSSVADGLSVTYASVTSAGDTTLTTSATGPTPPAGFNLGDPPTYYDIATTATVTSPITVCINYTNSTVPSPESDLRLLHFEGGSWVDVTTSLDTVTNVVCGSVGSLSPFVIAAPAQRALAATIEIKPEKWNVQWGTKDGHGKVSALIGNIAGHSVREIDPASVRLNGTVPVAEKGKDHKLHAKVKKHRKGFDGPVLEVKFNKFDAFRSLGPVSVGQTVTVRVTGTLRDGTPFEGTDTVLIIGKE